MTVNFEGFCEGGLRGAWIALFLVVFPAMAGHQTVTTIKDSVAGSFRNAVALAASGDTVSFNLSASDSVIGPSTQIIIDKNLVVLGRNGSNNKRMTIKSPWGGFTISRGKVLLSNLSLRSNGGVVYQGGVISILGATTEVKMDSVTITGGEFLYLGGGIYDSLATVNLNACTISGNTQSNTGGAFCCSYAGQGGGIYSYRGKLVITNSIISQNRASRGGGIYNDHGTVTITNSTIDHNAASIGGSQDGTSYGGGIFNHTGNLLIFNSTITNNSCTTYPTWSLINLSAEARGGGVCNLLGLVSIVNSTVCYNTSFAACDLNLCNGQAESGGVYSGNGGFIDEHNAIGNLIYTTIFGDTARNGTGLGFDGGFGDGNYQTYGLNNIFIGNAGGDGVVYAGRKNYVGDNVYGDTSVAEYNWINKEVFGKDTVKLADNGGPTKTIALYHNAMALGEGIRCGYFFYDTLFDTTYYKKEVTNIKPVYFNGTDWICVATKSPIPIGTQIIEITTDQRGFVRPDPPCIGAYEFGQMPIAIQNGGKTIPRGSAIKFIDFHGMRLTASFPIAGNYVINVFNPKGQMIEEILMHKSAGVHDIILSHSHAPGLYVVTAICGNLKAASRVFAW